MNITQPTDHLFYEGYEIYLSDPSHRMVCSYMIRRLRRPCRDIEHGKKIIDAHLALEAVRQPGEVRIVAADVRVVSGLKASACRNRIEQARAQKRQGGKFAKSELTLTNPVTGPVNIPFNYGGGFDFPGGAA